MTSGATNYIGGRWRPSVSGRTFPSLNPADENDVVGTFSFSDGDDVALAVEAAEAAFPSWRRTPTPSRAALITRAVEIMRQRKEELAQAMAREMGKVIAECRGDVQEGIDMAEYIAAYGRMPDGVTAPSERPDIACFARKVPVGVVGLITPWNFPFAIPTWKIFPALLTGNTLILKPAEDTPGCAVALVEILEEAGFPPGTVNLIAGDGTTGQALVEAPGVRSISFTGSSQVGRAIAARCGDLGKRVSCELGGKNAILVLDDANLELALKGALWSGFGTSGQRCTASSRLIVERGVLNRFRDELVHRTEALHVGAGSDPSTDVGPVINRVQRDRIAGYVDIGRAEGAQVLTGGRVLDDDAHRAGAFYAPTVLDHLTPSMRVAREEIFGPVVGIMEAADFDDAIRLANGTSYGLSLAIFTRDVFKAHRAIEELQSGIVYVNMPTTGAEIQFPFGGTKDTGNGHREAGWTALEFYTEWKSVYINYRDSDELVRAQIDTHN